VGCSFLQQKYSRKLNRASRASMGNNCSTSDVGMDKEID
jgi:hypothetical protein